MSETPLPPYSAEETETGERFARSPLTGTLYRVTEWVEVGDDKIVAISKEEVDSDE